MAAKPLLTPEELRKLLNYDPDTGLLTWRVREEGTIVPDRRRRGWNTRFAGKTAMTADNGDGYYRGHIGKVNMFAHRVAWAIHYGHWPDGELDHINGNRKDNRVVNLRLVARSENMRNRKVPSNNSSGVVGVSWSPLHQRCQTYISIGRKTKFLGAIKEFERAVEARAAAERKHGYHPNHGRAA